MYCTYTRQFVISYISHYLLHNLTWRAIPDFVKWPAVKPKKGNLKVFFFFLVSQLRELNQLNAVLHVTKKIKMHNIISLKCSNKYARLLTVAYTKNNLTH